MNALDLVIKNARAATASDVYDVEKAERSFRSVKTLKAGRVSSMRPENTSFRAAWTTMFASLNERERASSWPTISKAAPCAHCSAANTTTMPFCLLEKGQSLRKALTTRVLSRNGMTTHPRHDPFDAGCPSASRPGGSDHDRLSRCGSDRRRDGHGLLHDEIGAAVFHPGLSAGTGTARYHGQSDPARFDGYRDEPGEWRLF